MQNWEQLLTNSFLNILALLYWWPSLNCPDLFHFCLIILELLVDIPHTKLCSDHHLLRCRHVPYLGCGPISAKPHGWKYFLLFLLAVETKTKPAVAQMAATQVRATPEKDMKIKYRECWSYLQLVHELFFSHLHELLGSFQEYWSSSSKDQTVPCHNASHVRTAHSP